MPLRARQFWFVALVTLIVAILGAASVAAATVSVAAKNFQFSPASRTVRVGDTVRWTMSGDPHTVRSGTVGADGIGHPSSGPLNSDLIYDGGRYSFRFTKAGTYPYFCEIHADSGMKGTIKVVAAAPTPRLTPRPTPAPTRAATATPSPATAATESPTSGLTPSPPAVPSPEPTGSPSPAPVAVASPGPASDAGPTADVTPLAVAGILILIGILGAIVLGARRST